MRLFVAAPLRRSCVTLLLPALVHAFLPVLPLRTLSGPSRGALPRATRSGSLNVVMDAEPNFPEDAYQQVFVAEFIHVRKSLNTLLKLWLMGKPDGAKGWTGTGELEAKPASAVKSAAVECDSSAPSPCLRGPALQIPGCAAHVIPAAEESSSYFAASGATRSRRSCGVADADPNCGQAHLWHAGLDHRRGRARESLAALELAALIQQQRAADQVRFDRNFVSPRRVRARVEGSVRHDPTPTPKLQTLTPALARAVGPALTLSRLGHALLDELEMVARAEDVEDSLASPNAPWIESYTGPQALPPQGAHGGSGRLDTKTPSEGTMRREPEAAGLPQPHRSGVAARAGRLHSRAEIHLCAPDTIHGRLCDRPQAGDRLCFPPETLMGVRASLPPRRG